MWFGKHSVGETKNIVARVEEQEKVMGKGCCTNHKETSNPPRGREGDSCPGLTTNK